MNVEAEVIRADLLDEVDLLRATLEELVYEFAEAVMHIHRWGEYHRDGPWTECPTRRCRDASALYVRVERLLDGGGT